ncbi:rare lipoprotein A [Niabella hirudinis]
MRVTNLKNGRKVKVHINDRGPFVQGRIIDLSKKSAKKIGMLKDGVIPVTITYKKK